MCLWLSYPMFAPDDYFEYFKAHSITDIVRLNNKVDFDWSDYFESNNSQYIHAIHQLIYIHTFNTRHTTPHALPQMASVIMNYTSLMEAYLTTPF